ncbi:hypothetical protein SDC9_207029 [bioreactor metagenome]|uniref:Hut operon positive regulatory protein n=1 Tax=bioreactor metagenome TaxID=1076179 RepID=A0A645J6M1_9ZZZZ
MTIGSREVAGAALKMAVTADRNEEKQLQNDLKNIGIKSAGVDFGGDFPASISKLVERTIVAAQREGIIGDMHNEIGAVAGAAREAVSQIANKAIGFSVGGKIGIARYSDHVCVAVFFSISLVHLNETGVGLGHRAI